MELLSALIGAAVATIGTVLWETRLRPRHERLKAASVLRVEIAANRQTLIALKEFIGRHPDALPTDIDFDFAAFNALCTSLGSLGVDELVPVMELYSHLRYLERRAQTYRDEWEHTRTGSEASIRRADAESRLHNIRLMFRESLTFALEAADSAFATLDRIPAQRLGAPRLVVEQRERERIARLQQQQRM